MAKVVCSQIKCKKQMEWMKYLRRDSYCINNNLRLRSYILIQCPEFFLNPSTPKRSELLNNETM